MGRARITALTAAAAALLLRPDAARALSSRRTPVMGWSTWSVYGCDISEQKIKEQALAIDALGLRALGYEYIDIDDCRPSTAARTACSRPTPASSPAA